MLDGENRWGFVRIQVDRFGVTRYGLVVYPPGISEAERRRLRVWRGAPVWGAALWVVTQILLAPVLGPWPALTITTSVVTGLVVIALRRAGGLRASVRMICVVTMPGYTTEAMVADRERLRAMAATLLDADERVDAQRMSPLDHEALWWQVYDQLAPTQPRGHSSEHKA